MDTRPYYRRSLPKQQDPIAFSFDRVDLTSAHLPRYPEPDPSGALPDSRPPANSYFDARAAAAVCASVGNLSSVSVDPDPRSIHYDSGNNHRILGLLDPHALLEFQEFGDTGAGSIFILTNKCLAVMAYEDSFPNLLKLESVASFRPMVSEAIMKASPGFCGQFGPGISGAVDLLGGSFYDGSYDMTQMFMLPLAYRYYDWLTPEAQERLITELLAQGRIKRPNEDDITTSGGAPNDWSRAGYVSPLGDERDIPETENHVLMIATARYLTNQLLYQRDHDLSHDNRRNGDPANSRPNCTDQVLDLLRNELRDDFAEYNAKPYQEETRHALLNLCSYSYDAEVRLGARMVLDYISAHVAVSSNDLRRMVPFRRRNEDPYVRTTPGDSNFMAVGLLGANGTDPKPAQNADPMSAQFALLAGNTRAYEQPNGSFRPQSWAITPNYGPELTLGAISDYRLPPPIHDLFVNDLHRRFFQRLHRHPMLDEPGQQRNCDTMEIYAGSPSYLITAGSEPAPYIIDSSFLGYGNRAEDLGVAVPTSFMPTGLSGGADPNNAEELIQLSFFADRVGATENYGVAPDFACGTAFRLPAWTEPVGPDGDFFFIDRGSLENELAGFYLAIKKSGAFILMEAFDTWRHPGEVSFEQFKVM